MLLGRILTHIPKLTPRGGQCVKSMCKIHIEICLPIEKKIQRVPKKEQAIFIPNLSIKGNNLLTKRIPIVVKMF